MFSRKVEKSDWPGFLTALSKVAETQRAQIEVTSLRIGDQAAAEWFPLLGISYDPEDDVVEIALEEVDHLIDRPRELYFAEEAGRFTGLAILEADGTKHIVMLRQPFMLAS